MTRRDRIAKKRCAVFFRRLNCATKCQRDADAQNYMKNRGIKLMPGEAVYARCSCLSLDRQLP